ncbi:MAG: hypothetical protein ACKOCW_07985 [Planctomycetaceae bacterium]
MPRWILLEHTAAPDDPAGRHFDLLVEEGESCRSWRLAAIPVADGASVPAVAIAPHRLAWLDHRSGPVSGGRGFARRVAAGDCVIRADAAPAAGAFRWRIEFAGDVLCGTLVIDSVGDQAPVGPAAAGRARLVGGA